MISTGSIGKFAFAALLVTTALLPACATHDAGTRMSGDATLNAAPVLVPFASDEGAARLARVSAKPDFALLANQFEAQYNGAFCGPTSAAIVLNAVHSRSADLPRDHSRLRKEDLQFLPAGADPIVPRYTQDGVIDKGRKTRAQVLGEPITNGGKATRDFGYQLRQFDEMLRGNGLTTRVVVVDDAISEQAIRTETIVNGQPTWAFVQNNLNITGDNLFPSVALGLLQSMPSYISIIFIIALISALFPSADGALTALTSSFCIDILGIKERTDLNEKQKRKIRLTVHLTMTTIFFISILIFREINSRSIIDKILDLAGYTYGPLLGLFSFGILTKRTLPDSFIIALIALVSPALCYLLQINSPHLFSGYVIGIEILIINGLLTFIGLLIISKK